MEKSIIRGHFSIFQIHLRSYMRDKMAYFLREAMTAQQNIRAKNIQQLRGFKRYNSEIYP